MYNSSKIYIAGHNGMVGKSIWNSLKLKGYSNLIGKSKDDLNLKNQNEVLSFYNLEKPDIVINSAAKVGGILANKNYPYEFLMENMQIQNNLIDGALNSGVKKFIFLGSSCIYPKLCPQPILENYLLTNSLEKSNEGYAVSKITGVKACQYIKEKYNKDFTSLMPTNLYGKYDNFDLHSSHVIPAMIRKFHEAKEKNNSPVELWGDGSARREFLHVDDLAKAVIFTLENNLPDYIYNIGTGIDIKILDLAKLIQKIVGHKGDIIWDKSKPNGTPRKLLNIDKINSCGWKFTIELEDGLIKTYQWFKNNIDNIKKNKI